VMGVEALGRRMDAEFDDRKSWQLNIYSASFSENKQSQISISRSCAHPVISKRISDLGGDGEQALFVLQPRAFCRLSGERKENTIIVCPLAGVGHWRKTLQTSSLQKILEILLMQVGSYGSLKLRQAWAGYGQGSSST